MKSLVKFLKDEQGLELSEYAVLLALIIVFLFAVVILLAEAIGTKFQQVGEKLDSYSPPA